MIKDVPTHTDFYESGLEYSMVAYQNIINLFQVLEEYNYDSTSKVDPEIITYWESSNRKLKNFASILHQGVDFLLKSKICRISPYLLISSSIDKNLSSYSGSNTRSYADFFSIESAKLPALYNMLHEDKLSDSFLKAYEDSRKRRNKIMHTIDHKLKIEAQNLIKQSLFLITYLTDDTWIEIRTQYLEELPEYQLHHEAFVISDNLLSELSILKKILTHAEFEKIYSVKSNRRFFFCPNCSEPDMEYDTININRRSAVLNPNTPDSTNIDCVTCGHSSEITREDCEMESCPSNVKLVFTQGCGLCGVY